MCRSGGAFKASTFEDSRSGMQRPCAEFNSQTTQRQTEQTHNTATSWKKIKVIIPRTAETAHPDRSHYSKGYFFQDKKKKPETHQASDLDSKCQISGHTQGCSHNLHRP